MFGYIYKITNLENGRIYIGQHKGKRGRFDKWYLGSGKIIKQAVEKYGKKSFKVEIVYVCDDQISLDQYEKNIIEDHRKTFGSRLYNINDGGFGGRHKGCDCTVCKRMRKEILNKNPHKEDCQCAPCLVKRGEMKVNGKENPNYGNRMSEDMKRKIGNANRHPRLHPLTCACPFCKSKRAKAVYVYEIQTLSDIKKLMRGS